MAIHVTDSCKGRTTSAHIYANNVYEEMGVALNSGDIFCRYLRARH